MSEKRSIVLLTLVTIVTTAALLLTACGGGDGDGDGSEAGSEAAATDTSGDGGNGEDNAEASDEPSDEGNNADDDGSSAGEVPDACSLVEDSEVEALIGVAEPEGESDIAIDMVAYSQCSWENDEGLFIVSVVDSPKRFESHVDNLPGEPLDGVGQKAITLGGVSSETRGATGGRTISALVGDRTLVVALKVEGQTTVEMVAPIATTIAGRLES